MKSKKSKIMLYVLSLPVIVALVFGAILFSYAVTPIHSAKEKTVVVDIPTGSSLIQIIKILHDADLVQNRFLFHVLVTVKGGARSVRAGEYEFAATITPSHLADKLLHGDIKKYPVTIYEDSSLSQVALRLQENKLINEKDFFELSQDAEFLSELGIRSSSMEGYLFPDTYFLDRSMTTRRIMRMMVERFQDKVSPEMIRQAAQKGLNVHQFVTFASLVGKESGCAAEKPLIAAVFYNRLKKGMPLQSDPTAVYDLKNFKGKVMRSHYKRESPYNTYLIRGLPPGPIASPGLDSFQAVLQPAAVDYLYFVSKGDGTHHFSSSLMAHNDATVRFRNMINRKEKVEETVR
ncbi:MAG TPA: endolytic transglycosylase MltG [Smithellaceae bacterium]|mgnify:FL=1|nr:endolytic transglycosylase MltG [Smithellaceae bacterium]HQP05913.1 endolytic transglycosylase MltG [Smithellaceae bacterium]